MYFTITCKVLVVILLFLSIFQIVFKKCQKVHIISSKWNFFKKKPGNHGNIYDLNLKRLKQEARRPNSG